MTITAEFDPITESVRAARRFVADSLADFDRELADDAALLVSELATNATIHARTTFRISVTRTGHRVRIEVADGSRGTPRRQHYGPEAATGRGLGMVADLAAAWGVEPGRDGKVIWFELHAGADGAADAARRGAVAATTPELDADLDAILADLGGWDDEPGTSAPKARRSLVGS